LLSRLYPLREAALGPQLGLVAGLRVWEFVAASRESTF
jgi:hypothetical protein